MQKAVGFPSGNGRKEFVEAFQKGNPSCEVVEHDRFEYVFTPRAATRLDFCETFKCQCINHLDIPVSQEILRQLETNGVDFDNLDLSGTYTEKRYSQALAECLRWNSSVTTLSLARNSLRRDSLPHLCSVLNEHDNSTLRTLDLSSNPLGEVAAAMLGQFLATNRSLENLFLDSTKLGHGKVSANN